MKINREHEFKEHEVTDAVEANEACMSVIYEMLIEPNSELDENDHMVLGVIGATFQDIAKKAYQFEQIQKGENSQN